jgi:hypothetical protein
MSFLEKNLPWLFEDVPPTPAGGWAKHVAEASPARKQELLEKRSTPPLALAHMARDQSTDVRRVLSDRLAQILPSLSASEQVEVYDITLGAIRSLAEDEVTAVRVALASALKDVAGVPNAVARKLADDAEREVAEPILRHSMSLSDADLLELIAQHPHDWHPITIAQRSRLSAQVAEAIAKTENTEAKRELIRNDGVILDYRTHQLLGESPALQVELDARQSIARKLRREWIKVTDPILSNFLHARADFDQVTTEKVMRRVHQNMGVQDDIKKKSPAELSPDGIAEALKLGENAAVISALVARSGQSESIVKRMLDSNNGRAVVALCVKADMPMSFALSVQQKIARLPTAKIVYPKEGGTCPLSQDELHWQWDFFGVK